MSGARVELSEPWSIGASGFSVAGASSQASKVTVEVRKPASGCGVSDTPEQIARVEIDADTWREIVRTVESRLVQRGDPQR
jgi:hypothetical protein